MTFTYDLTYSAEISKVRFELGDTSESSGVRADGSNFTDEELQMLLDREGSTMLAVAAACEMLARDWARVASISAPGRSEQFGKVSAEYASRARELREQYGSTGTTFSVGFDRTDGYSAKADGTYE